MNEPSLTIMKCCNRAKHTAKCVQYWHQRQREEVRKRVEGEKEMNKQMLANESKLFAQFETKELDMCHELAIEMEWHARSSEIMCRFIAKVDAGKISGNSYYDQFKELLA